MAAFWKLVPKLKPEHRENFERFASERDDLRCELRKIGILSRILVPGKSKRRRELKRRTDLLDRQIAACHRPVGADLSPPRIGIDAKATKWYRRYLEQDAQAWPLPPDEMIEEMTGHPVWALRKPKVPFELGLDWPTQPLPIPSGPGLSLELLRDMVRDITGEQAVALGARMRDEVLAHLRNRYPQLSDSREDQLLATIQKGTLQGMPPGDPSEAELQQALSTISASLWLVFWGGHGYSFTTGETVG